MGYKNASLCSANLTYLTKFCFRLNFFNSEIFNYFYRLNSNAPNNWQSVNIILHIVVPLAVN